MATTMTFTDSAILRIKPQATTEWYSDKTYRGLRLAVTSGGTKTWYALNWDGTAQKARQVKIGHFPKMKRNETQRIAAEVKSEMDAGAFMNRAEKAIKATVDKTPLPTLAEALDAYLKHRMGERFTASVSVRVAASD